MDDELPPEDLVAVRVTADLLIDAVAREDFKLVRDVLNELDLKEARLLAVALATLVHVRQKQIAAALAEPSYCKQTRAMRLALGEEPEAPRRG